MKLNEITDWLQNVFADYQCDDYSNNGLQVEASADVTKVAFAVDGSLQSMERAVEANAQLLVVHHGISWGNGFARVTGTDAQRFAVMFKGGLSLYGMHLPLDAHLRLGNNAVIAEKMALKDIERFYQVKGMEIAVSGIPDGIDSLKEINDRLLEAGVSDRTVVMDNSNGKVSRVGVVSGQCGDMFDICRRNGIDCLITGEMLHSAYHSAKENGVSVIAAGHYATETWGVRALMPEMAALGLDTIFIDVPTGL